MLFEIYYNVVIYYKPNLYVLYMLFKIFYNVVIYYRSSLYALLF